MNGKIRDGKCTNAIYGWEKKVKEHHRDKDKTGCEIPHFVEKKDLPFINLSLPTNDGKQCHQ